MNSFIIVPRGIAEPTLRRTSSFRYIAYAGMIKPVSLKKAFTQLLKIYRKIKSVHVPFRIKFFMDGSHRYDNPALTFSEGPPNLLN